jgi:hypothetical protein
LFGPVKGALADQTIARAVKLYFADGPRGEHEDATINHWIYRGCISDGVEWRGRRVPVEGRDTNGVRFANILRSPERNVKRSIAHRHSNVKWRKNMDTIGVSGKCHVFSKQNHLRLSHVVLDYRSERETSEGKSFDDDYGFRQALDGGALSEPTLLGRDLLLERN